MLKVCLVLSTILSLNLYASDIERPLDIFKYLGVDNFEMVLQMVDQGVDVNIKNPRDYNNTLLIDLSYKYRLGGDNVLKLALELLKRGADPNPKNNFGTSALVFAAKFHPNILMLEAFVKHGGRLSERFYIGETLLHSSMENPHKGAVEIVKFLIDRGIDVNSINDNELTPLMKACSSNCKQYEGCGFKSAQIRELVRRGADLAMEDKYFEFDALKFAIDSSNGVYVERYEDIEFLLINGSQVDDFAIRFAENDSLKQLLRAYR